MAVTMPILKENMVNNVYDVIVVGTGPAGLTAANLLARKGLDVLIVDRGIKQALQLPETFYGISHDLLVRMNIEKKIQLAVEAPKQIRLVSTNESFNYQIEIEPKRFQDNHDGMGLNREIFEQVLIDSAISCGATYSPNIVVKDFIFNHDQITGVKGWTPDGYIEFTAKMVIDARGKQTPLADHLGIKTQEKKPDSYIAVFSHFVGNSLTKLIPNDGILVVTVDGGYLLVMMLPNERVSVMAVLFEEKARNSPRNLDKVFQETVDSWEPLAKAIQAARKVTATQPVMNYDWEYDKYSGNGFVIVGDAVAFLDPFFCNGVAIGMNGGEIAADFVVQGLANRGSHNWQYLSNYDQQIRDLIHKWERVWGIEKLSLCSISLLKQTIGLLGHLSFLKLGAINEKPKQNSHSLVISH
ncbi:NAD(P)/FAD-dependent oxidoreductase [Nostoc sp. TCL26-01]|uniref:NAD(P)/FAD-dependent oxidoreductase n=1 Tax=Nostoc sp. TCL26-01 TaxID=2576904 RepID=UPI0015BA3A33|nr:NAD(P)/FAD-dependent oxidoreductase [Nostoc sp. TCL26-01]QLE58165.1 NAD(P)/FAD-dependent oxidoreductase [Nostoc sp. TCL26-01]